MKHAAKLWEAMFISDLHLHPNEPKILKNFARFINMAQKQTKAVYILGDFIHAWPGDDAMDAWSMQLTALLEQLAASDVKCYFMPGNRDFLLKEDFAKVSKWQILPDPYLCEFADLRVLLSHGDRFCTKDLLHQIFMQLTRGKFFARMFLLLPLRFRKRCVQGVRKYSVARHIRQNKDTMDVVEKKIVQDMLRYKTTVLIHGHTHKSCKNTIKTDNNTLSRFVLSDWDDDPSVLCYSNIHGFMFNLI